MGCLIKYAIWYRSLPVELVGRPVVVGTGPLVDSKGLRSRGAEVQADIRDVKGLSCEGVGVIFWVELSFSISWRMGNTS